MIERKFPERLRQKGRSIISKDKFLSSHVFYVRHKPGIGWNEAEGLPDFTKLKVDQSMNWNVLSLPSWSRFNDKGEYFPEYAVISYLYGSIISTQLRLEDFPSERQIVDVQHVPIELNYAHCELELQGGYADNFTKSQRRALRMQLKHKAVVELRPNEENPYLRRKWKEFMMVVNQFF